MNISPGFFVLHVRQMAGSTANNGAVALAISDKPPIFVEDVEGTRIRWSLGTSALCNH